MTDFEDPVEQLQRPTGLSQYEAFAPEGANTAGESVLEQLRQQLDVVRDQLAQAHAALEAERLASKDLDEENKLLMRQLHEAQEELERLLYPAEQALIQEPPRKTDRPISADVDVTDSRRQARLQQGGVTWIRWIGERLPPIAEQRRLRSDIKLIRQSGWFDEEWYLAQYPDVARAGADPVRHYLRFGAREGRNPSLGFDTLFYLQQYSDVADSGINPLVHFIRFGRHEGRIPRKQLADS